MTDSELKKLKRTELLEILITQSAEIERLKTELAELQDAFESRTLKISNAGSLAEAALALNGVFESAQAAADQYLENVKNTEETCKKLIEDAKGQAAQIVATAEAEATVREAEAKKEADKYYSDVTQKLESFYDQYQGLRDLLNVVNKK